MDIQRASEIAQSPDMKHVTYQGERIYIQHVDGESGMARVYPLDDPANAFDIPVDQLQENNM